MNEIALIIVALVVLVVVGGGVLWGFSLYSREQRRLRSGHDRDYPPPPPPLPPQEGLPAPSLSPPDSPHTSPRIRWGHVPYQDDYVVPEQPGSIQWGDVNQEAEQYEYVEVNPQTEDERIKCPICQQRIDEVYDEVFICSNSDCATMYHQTCWTELGGTCHFCRRQYT